MHHLMPQWHSELIRFEIQPFNGTHIAHENFIAQMEFAKLTRNISYSFNACRLDLLFIGKHQCNNINKSKQFAVFIFVCVCSISLQSPSHFNQNSLSRL